MLKTGLEKHITFTTLFNISSYFDILGNATRIYVYVCFLILGFSEDEIFPMNDWFILFVRLNYVAEGITHIVCLFR